jgi:hypothetical protein
LLFAGLVATWLAVLVPMAARRRKQVTRPSDAALSCRVLERPRRSNQEVTMNDAAVSHNRTATGAPEPREALEGERAWQPPSPGYRRGRGGYDAEAAALAAQAKYTFRQRLVLVLVFFAGISALLALTLRMLDAWYLHIAVDLSLIGYLVYLRRQVRMENDIRARRAARMAGSRTGAPDGADHAEDRTAAKPTTVAEAVAAMKAARAAVPAEEPGEINRNPNAEPKAEAKGGETQGRSVRAPRGTRRASAEADAGDTAPTDTSAGPQPARESALPRLRPAPSHAPPAGTVPLDLDAEDPELHELADRQQKGYRRAVGQ